MIIGKKRGVLKSNDMLREQAKTLFVLILFLNLLSLSKIFSTKKRVRFDHKCKFIVDKKEVECNDQALLSKLENLAEIWHKRFHLRDTGYIKRLVNNSMVDGCNFEISQIEGKLVVSKSCELRKQARHLFIIQEPVGVLPSLICQQAQQGEYDGLRHLAVVYLMRYSNLILEKFKELEALVYTNFLVQNSKLRSGIIEELDSLKENSICSFKVKDRESVLMIQAKFLKMYAEASVKLPIDESGERMIGLKRTVRSWKERSNEVVRKMDFDRLHGNTSVHVSEDQSLCIALKSYGRGALCRFGIQLNHNWMKIDIPPKKKQYQTVCYFSRFQNCATERHWSGLQQVLRYLRGTTKLFVLNDALDDNCVCQQVGMVIKATET
ncbi:uncharacterized protein LOC119769455 [Culex quinquefasciatus]|uniref:uncharacterized protein LOC119769455 n=1 Tax=Culex quinquefasciatus TaxID=7176 RepID=UPI0018E2D6DD|nr:uncharacterized protein LOC119769455 [Culex quinquefasciatus]XP_038117869.1 uncharacterized protein LOC119769455 [Culex quinquefasciatus]XP_038117870.1 uncharacterized protein LOC119769455 [Culex quinquefasciatus]